MSTRSTTHFTDGREAPRAIIYRHSDGYPEGAGADILRFFEEVKRDVEDTRFSDPDYLAAKYVVFLARQFATSYEWIERHGKREFVSKPNASPLDFLSVGVVMKDPNDIDYRYIVDCNDLSRGRPAVYVIEVHGVNYGGDRQLGEIADVLADEPGIG